MKKILVLFGLIICVSYVKAQFQVATAPVAEKQEHWRTIHGDSVLDNYYWMYDYFGKGPDSTKAVDYLVAENAYLDTVMSGTKKLQADLFAEMKARIKEKDESVPVFKNGYYYYSQKMVSSIINIAAEKEAYRQKRKYCWMLIKWRKDMPIMPLPVLI